MVSKCLICQEISNCQSREPLMPRETPTRPWQILSTDIFELKVKEYLILVDFYSKFPFVYQIQGHPKSFNIILILKKLFSEHGIPEILISDNGRQYSSAEFRKFTDLGTSNTPLVVHTIEGVAVLLKEQYKP